MGQLHAKIVWQGRTRAWWGQQLLGRAGNVQLTRSRCREVRTARTASATRDLRGQTADHVWHARPGSTRA
eukprot:48281-Rhodomonas_salina.1